MRRETCAGRKKVLHRSYVRGAIRTFQSRAEGLASAEHAIKGPSHLLQQAQDRQAQQMRERSADEGRDAGEIAVDALREAFLRHE